MYIYILYTYIIYIYYIYINYIYVNIERAIESIPFLRPSTVPSSPRVPRLQAPEQWQKSLTSALSVAALSVIDGTAIFHAPRGATEPWGVADMVNWDYSGITIGKP
jgi:hypothetical protein